MARDTKEEQLKSMVDTIVREFAPEKVILFGSYAWGTPTEDSDVDLVVIKETDNTRRLAREIDGTLFPRMLPLDLMVWRPSYVAHRERMGDMFVQEVLSKGKVLYVRNGA